MIAVFLGLLGSVFYYSVNAFEKHSSALNDQITDLTGQKQRAEKNLQVLQTTLSTQCQPQLAAKITELAQANTNAARLQKDLTAAQTAAQVAAARADEQANNAKRDLAVLQQKLNDLQASQKK